MPLLRFCGCCGGLDGNNPMRASRSTRDDARTNIKILIKTDTYVICLGWQLGLFLYRLTFNEKFQIQTGFDLKWVKYEFDLFLVIWKFIKCTLHSSKNNYWRVVVSLRGAHNTNVFGARWTYSSKTSSFGGYSAQSLGIALFFSHRGAMLNFLGMLS